MSVSWAALGTGGPAQEAVLLDVGVGARDEGVGVGPVGGTRAPGGGRQQTDNKPLPPSVHSTLGGHQQPQWGKLRENADRIIPPPPLSAANPPPTPPSRDVVNLNLRSATES